MNVCGSVWMCVVEIVFTVVHFLARVSTRGFRYRCGLRPSQQLHLVSAMFLPQWTSNVNMCFVSALLVSWPAQLGATRSAILSTGPGPTPPGPGMP